jgi:FtsP/CotA-like multicopper oxidase with cupredoxin domain
VGIAAGVQVGLSVVRVTQPRGGSAAGSVLDQQRDKRYRLRFHNASDDLHPMHVHRHTFEVTHIAGTPTAGVRKDVTMLGGYQSAEIEFVADQPGLSLLHCHQQIHMDYGLMLLLNSN